MSILEKVKSEVDLKESGTVLTYSDFSISADKFMNLAKSLSVLCKEGSLKRISKGVYYKPKVFPFGTSLPSDEQLIKTVLGKSKINIAYVTGATLYNQLGLSTQVSKEIVIATDRKRTNTKIQNTEIRFIKAKVTQNIDKTLDIPLLQILDALMGIRKIPDSNINTSCKILLQTVKMLSEDQKIRLGELALNYPPSTRALAGAFLELLGIETQAKLIKNTLNTLTTYKLGIDLSTLPNKSNWNIQ